MTTIITGFLVAMAISLTGVGAGTITAPALIILLGVEPITAVGTALVFALAIKVPVSVGYIVKKNIDYAILKRMLIGGIPGVIGGSLLAGWLGHSDQFKIILMAGVGTIIIFSAGINLYFMIRKIDFAGTGTYAIIPPLTFLIGLEVGFSSAGAGALGSLLLIFATALPAAAVIGTDILFGLILAAIGGGLHLGMGNVDFNLLGLLLTGGVAGAFLGTAIAGYIPNKPLKAALLLWLLFIGGQMLVKGVTAI